MVRSERYISFNDVHRGDVWKTDIGSQGRLVVIVTPHTAWANTFILDVNGDFEHHFVTDEGTFNACKMSYTPYARMLWKVGTVSEEKMQDAISIFLDKVLGLHVGESKADSELQEKYEELQGEYYKVFADNMAYKDIFTRVKDDLDRMNELVADPEDEIVDEPEEEHVDVDKSNEFYSFVEKFTPNWQTKARVFKVLRHYSDIISEKGRDALNDISVNEVKGMPGVGPAVSKAIDRAVRVYTESK